MHLEMNMLADTKIQHQINSDTVQIAEEKFFTTK